MVVGTEACWGIAQRWEAWQQHSQGLPGVKGGECGEAAGR